MTEDLRSQTQSRVDESSWKSEGVYVGISKHNLEFQKLEEIAPATTFNRDLNKKMTGETI